METIIHQPIPSRQLKRDHFYFVRDGDNDRVIVAFLTSAYKPSSFINIPDNIVLLFGYEDNTNEILWTSEKAFYKAYTVISEVNQMHFK